MFVGIDQSYSGFAVTFLWADGEHVTIVKKFDPNKHGGGIDRLVDIQNWLMREIRQRDETERIEHICMEGYALASRFGREQAGELGAIVKDTLWCSLESPVRYPTIVAPTSLKKYVLGVGKGGKNEMLLGVYKQWGVEFKDDNAADSYGLARLAQDIQTDSARFQYQKDVIKALRIHTERIG